MKNRNRVLALNLQLFGETVDLKTVLGDELFAQVSEKLGDKHKIAIVSDGSWFPKSKFDVVNEENKTLKETVKTHEAQLETLSKAAKGNEELQGQIRALQEANDKATKDYNAQIEQMKLDSAIDRALVANKAKNPKAVRALLSLDKIKLDGENLFGLDEQLKTLKTSDAYLFDGAGGGSGTNPPADPNLKNPWLKETFNLTEQGRITVENPTLAAQLRAAAGK